MSLKKSLNPGRLTTSIPPEMQSKVSAFNREIGNALVTNLNRRANNDIGKEYGERGSSSKFRIGNLE